MEKKELGKQLKKIFEEQAYYYNVLKNKDNIVNEDLVCFIDECLSLEEFSKQLNEREIEMAASIIYKADEAISIMRNLLEEWQNINTTSNPQETMFSRWFSIMITSMYLHHLILLLHEGKREENKYTALFEARDLFFKTAQNCGFDPSQADTIFQNIECSLGYNGPIKLKPLPETPGAIFGLALVLQNIDVYKNKMIASDGQEVSKH